MGIADAVKVHMRPSVAEQMNTPEEDHEKGFEMFPSGVEGAKPAESVALTAEAGVATIEAAQAVWGKRGRYLLIIGEIDNSTVYIYKNYSTSSFDALSVIASISTASTVIFAAVKPPLAKISNVIGRGQTYLIAISFFVLSYIVMASATSIGAYAAGSILYTIGQSGTNILNDIIISDITTARWRAFAIGVSFAPFLVTVWCAAFIVDSVVAEGGIGWRWGIGMLAILMPFCASFIITTLLYYQARAKKLGLAPRVKMTLYTFCSQIDLGGIILFTGGLVLLLLPMSFSGLTPSEWHTSWVIALITIGAALLIALPFYEHYLAKYPLIPPSYFKNITILMCILLVAMDSLSFSCTHSYLYAWGSVAHGFSARDDTFYTYTNGVVQCLVGIITGWIVGKTRRYKWIAFAGVCIRTVGYGIMLRLRGNNNSTGELFAVQVIQGIGSGVIATTLVVPAQICVPHAQMPQVTALFVCFSFVGSSIGSCIAGGIYTNAFRPALWHHLGDSATTEMVNTLFNSITGLLPAWGSPEREAINAAYSDVIRYMTYAALGASIPGPFMALILPDHVLPDRNNLVEG
ncbi:Siderophore iron transporter 1 [Cytospora mali]|uniref:Siderophore iron transporter 1 n=1 Tax=Cytospora mali TaxID=578113 RepID=A0A194W2P1_CYTMA|nr:Siderophore iron transporter 1 [Valsa mali]